MRRYWTKFSLLICFFLFAVFGCSNPNILPDDKPDEDAQDKPDWQALVNDVKNMTRSMKIPQHFIDENTPEVDEVFDPNQLLVPLSHLKLHPGYTLDFIYHYDGMGGRPFVYAREVNAPPFESLDEFDESVSACQKENPTLNCSYLDFVEVDGTSEGYFQYVLLHMMGGQFYLYWHSGYDDAEIIASHERLAELVAQLSSDEVTSSLSWIKKQKALNLDPLPKVSIEGDIVTVRVLWFTKWGGFTESIYSLAASAPHKIIDVEESVLLEYDCGIMF